VVADTTSSILLPESDTVGLAWWQIRNDQHEWKLEFNMDWVRWNSIRSFDIHQSNGIPLLSPQNWSDSLTYAVGTEYKWLRPSWLPAWDVAMRAGYNRSQTPVPDRNFSPTPPDADVNVLSIGAGFLCGASGKFLGLIACGSDSGGFLTRKALGIDLAYQAVLFEKRTVTGSPDPNVDGTYRTTNHAGSVTARINF
jgi:long-chain fatty acid transport protein